jgi:23S rRNA-/tRNA-specific pseudouridylate synthase
LVHEFLHVDIHVDKTVVHRLDMDTSGIVVFALTPQSLSTLHDDFRHRRVQKTYHALVCGHVDSEELEIDLALERDPHHSPFMRVARTEERNPFSSNAISKFLHQAPKPSLTQVRILSYEFIERLPVTRLELRPHTGRTHQLRVHCAAIGHPIVGDDIYGYNGEGAPNGGLDSVEACSIDVQRRIQELGHPLCLHAQQLCIHHPRTRAPMIFQADASF